MFMPPGPFMMPPGFSMPPAGYGNNFHPYESPMPKRAPKHNHDIPSSDPPEELDAQIEPPKPHAAENRAADEPTRREHGLVEEDPEHGQAGDEHVELERAEPEAGPHGPDDAHQPRRDPGSRYFKRHAERPSEADLRRAVARGEQVGDHLAAEAEDGEVKEAAREGRQESVVAEIQAEVLLRPAEDAWDLLPATVPGLVLGVPRRLGLLQCGDPVVDLSDGKVLKADRSEVHGHGGEDGDARRPPVH